MSNSTKTIRAALEEFYLHQGLGREAFERDINFFQIGPVNIPFPNFEGRKKNSLFT